MSHRLFLIVTLSLFTTGLFTTGTLVSSPIASAETPLTRATVKALRNQVQLILKNRVTRAAQTADTMTPGDSLATARQAFAELRFNDSSLARIGERTLFQFVPNTRSFYLGNGTALLLIPPGQGRTNVRTPNAAAGIRGSALFVRYNEDTNTTIVGALTNSRIEVSNGENAQAQTLKAGQMAVIIQNQLVQVYNFDLKTFYQTSALVSGLDLPLNNATPSADAGIAAVQAETAQAIKEQSPLTGPVSENPTFVSLSPAPGLQIAVTPGSVSQITLTPSGFDLSTARQTLIANPSAQAFTQTVTGVQMGVTLPTQLSISSPATASAATQVQPVTLPPLTDPRVVPVGTIPSTPAPSNPTPTPVVPPPTAPSAAVPPPPTPSAAVPPPTTSVPPVTVPQPSPALPSTPIASPAPRPDPIVTPAPAVPLTPTPIASPAPRPDPIVTPAPVAIPTPTPINPAAETSAVQTTITVPLTVAPPATTVEVQTGTAGTSLQVQTGTTGGTAAPAVIPATILK